MTLRSQHKLSVSCLRVTIVPNVFSYWSRLAQRELVGEVMDDPSLPEREHQLAMQGLRRINAISRTVPTLCRYLFEVLDNESGRPSRILDLACGDGENALAIARLAARRGLNWRVDGCDISRRAVDMATSLAQRHRIAASFFQADALKDPLAEGYDAVVSSLFLHHLEDDQIVALLQQLRNAKHLVISDLVRSRRAYLTTLIGVRCLSRSRVVHVDGPFSVRAALTPMELQGLAEQAGLTNARVRRCWPMRQVLTWSRP